MIAEARAGGGPQMRSTADAADRLAWLESQLRSVLAAGVHSDAGTRALYTSDASNYRILPAIVAKPSTIEQLATTVALSAEAGVPVTMRGAGTSVAGNACGPGVLVDTTLLNRVLDIDPASQTATVEPGVVLDDLNRQAAAHGLRLGPDPSTHSRCTLGGMVGNNACGARSVRWGTTADSVRGLRLILPDGRLAVVGSVPMIRGTAAQFGPLDVVTETALRALAGDNLGLLRRELPPWPRRVSGYALDWLLPERGFDVAKALVGTEGTCSVVAAVTLALVRPPESRLLLVLGFRDDVEAAHAVPALLTEHPFTVEGMTADLFVTSHDRPTGELLPPGNAWLLVEAGGESRDEAATHAARLTAVLGRRPSDAAVRLLDDTRAQEALWRVREDGAGRATRLPDGSPAWPGFEDAAVPPEHLASYLSSFRELLVDHGLRGTTYGHFGEGCIHIRIGFGLDRPGGVERLSRFMSAAADLVVSSGGTLSGEHGDGRARSALLGRMYSGDMLALFGRFKAIWDPTGTLNPGIVVSPVALEHDIRSASPSLLQVTPSLAYGRDGGDFRAAVARCVGIGKCVSSSSPGLMCPSYRATLEERHSTRGRARLLQEMVAGSLSEEGWRSEAVREALDLCLACKGCLSECPTSVDIASYKSEFLHRYYRRRLRPPSHYSLGWLPLWLRLTRRVPRLVNAFVGAPVVGRLFSRVAGIAPGRRIPPLARRTFVRSFRPTPITQSRGRVVLWPDTFNNYLTPNVAHAAVAVLARAGFEVTVPLNPVCCGLTWITTGQLDIARRVLRRTVSVPELAGEEPIVVLEPSCAAALRHDARELLPGDRRVEDLARRVTTLAELLDSVDFEVAGASSVSALVQPHCHQQAVLGTESDRRVLARASVEIETMLAGCCGLAGNFGAENGHQQVARAVAELELLPALARVRPTTAVLADGFSCRTQIESLTGTRALHLAELLERQLEGSAEP